MAQIKINNIIYGTTDATEVIYNGGSVADKLDEMIILDVEDNADINSNNNDYLTYGHIVDSLTSEATNKALSANQGKILNKKISNINNNLNIKRLDCTSNTTAVDVQAFILENSKNVKYSCVQVFNNYASENVYNMGFGEYGNFFIFILRTNPSEMILFVFNHWNSNMWNISVSENGYHWIWNRIFIGEINESINNINTNLSKINTEYPLYSGIKSVQNLQANIWTMTEAKLQNLKPGIYYIQIYLGMRGGTEGFKLMATYQDSSNNDTIQWAEIMFEDWIPADGTNYRRYTTEGIWTVFTERTLTLKICSSINLSYPIEVEAMCYPLRLL